MSFYSPFSYIIISLFNCMDGEIYLRVKITTNRYLNDMTWTFADDEGYIVARRSVYEYLRLSKNILALHQSKFLLHFYRFGFIRGWCLLWIIWSNFFIQRLFRWSLPQSYYMRIWQFIIRKSPTRNETQKWSWKKSFQYILKRYVKKIVPSNALFVRTY